MVMSRSSKPLVVARYCHRNGTLLEQGSAHVNFVWLPNNDNLTCQCLQTEICIKEIINAQDERPLSVKLDTRLETLSNISVSLEV